jgi:hypothetical protein
MGQLRWLSVFKQSLKLNILQHETLIGTLLGNASIPKQKKKSTHFVKFEQKEARKVYIDYLYITFNDFVKMTPKIRVIKKSLENEQRSYWFRTYRHPRFSGYYDFFYKQGKKTIPERVALLLSPRVLAFLFMDVGQRYGNSFVLNMQRYSKEELEFFADALNKRFGLVTNIHKDRNSFKIYISMKSVLRLRNIIGPIVYEVKSMRDVLF